MTGSHVCVTSQLIGGLADEKVRWAESVDIFNKLLYNVMGDVMMAAGVVSYLGAFTVSNFDINSLFSSIFALILLLFF